MSDDRKFHVSRGSKRQPGTSVTCWVLPSRPPQDRVIINLKESDPWQVNPTFSRIN
jgi:hypothetical protein